jgi:tetratricopeptide (TPR) repeat protein
MTEADAEKLRRADAALAEMRWAEAVELYGAELVRKPDRPAILNNLGIALTELNRMAEAMAMFRKAFSIAPTDPMVVANYGNFLSYLGIDDVAVAAYEAALSLAPDHKDIAGNYSMVLLRAGRLAEGWRAFERRTRHTDPSEAAGIPLLDDLDGIAGKTVLVFHEQGFGDSLMMLRFVPHLAARGARVILRMPPELMRLAGTVAGVAQVVGEFEEPPPIDVVSPMMSLPRLLGITLETIPAKMPYVMAETAERAAWRRALGSLPGPRIGLVWAGSPRGGLDRRRSMTFQHLRPLFDLPASFVSLQKGPAGADWAPLGPAAALDPTDRLSDFAATAALVAELDLVIAVDTSTAHLAGSLGVPVWLLNRYDTCWRWQSRRIDSPWYPSLRLFRQPKPGDWEGTVAAATETLKAWLPAPRP